ncbi:MAG: hypothetical protein NC408_04470 [Candidatus Gastranaerophilales bacterium]|nr:hypothetical protein [Candidatus Gastranaerophilales bacterium]MCM1072274.1 hypothetical protein [Bacteroides sp.]
MANLFDLLKGTGNSIKNAGNTLYNRIIQRNDDTITPQIAPLQMTEDGRKDNAASLALKNKTTPLTFGERMLGRTMEEDFQTIDPKTGETKMETLVNYRPGLLNDIAGGYKENRFTPASLNNFGQNALEGGRGKGFGYRLGEGLGSLARFGESPLGRSLLVGGIIGASGGSGLEALAYGGTAGMLNQANRSADRIYRDDLIQSQQNALKNSPEFAKLGETEEGQTEQQRQLQNIADNIYAQKGYINKDIYSNLIRTQQLRDDADWKRLYFDAQQANLKEQQEWRKQQAQMQRQEAAANRAVQMRGQDLNYELGRERLENQGQYGLSKADQKIINENNQTLADINAGLQLIEENPNAYSWIKGKLGADITNRLDPKGIKARTAIDNITAVYRKWLTGAQMSDAERKAYERFLPAPTDNYQTVKAKLEGMRDSIQRKNDVISNNYGNNIGLSSNNDPLGIL